MAEFFFLFLHPYPRDLLFFFSSADRSPPSHRLSFPLKNLICSVSSSPVRRVLLGVDPSAFRSRELPPALPPASSLCSSGFLACKFWYDGHSSKS
ncbi:hypothetical protein SLEP1_g47368 [Rubroshorea leprosula]|uniref:Uncharacterized protein n=1 Tax=Rubroshorea leprosula TaxID=152421 RepID=A0AAV5LQ95_9ROSI|nr:hypothetical protein SLEP1_g47368 [Rubroshorea leprosula]